MKCYPCNILVTHISKLGENIFQLVKYLKSFNSLILIVHYSLSIVIILLVTFVKFNNVSRFNESKIKLSL